MFFQFELAFLPETENPPAFDLQYYFIKDLHFNLANPLEQRLTSACFFSL